LTHEEKPKPVYACGQKRRFLFQLLFQFFQPVKEPYKLYFLQSACPVAAEKAQELQKHVDKPTPQGEKVLKEHEVKQNPTG
jgi:hypothetical protein